MVVHETVPHKDAPLESDPEVYEALQRKGLAFHLVGLCTYSVCMAWVSRLFNFMASAPFLATARSGSSRAGDPHGSAGL